MKTIKRPRDLRPDQDILHKGIWADSGAGKTYTMNEVHKDCKIPSIMIAQPKDEDDYTLYGDSVSSMKDLYKKLQKGKKIHFNPPSNNMQFLKEVYAIYQVCKEVDGEVLVLIDEVHRLLVSTSKNSDVMELGDMMTDGRGFGVRFMVSSQFLKRFTGEKGQVVVGSCQEHVFMQINDMDRGFYEYYNFPWKEMKEIVNKVQYGGIRYRKGEGYTEQAFKFS